MDTPYLSLNSVYGSELSFITAFMHTIMTMAKKRYEMDERNPRTYTPLYVLLSVDSHPAMPDSVYLSHLSCASSAMATSHCAKNMWMQEPTMMP